MTSSVNRRDVLTGMGTMAAILGSHGALAAVPVLDAGPGEFRLAPASYPATKVWMYGGAVPGPEIRVRQGGRVQRRFRNNLPQPSSVHWHGIRIENAMDGVAGMTQQAVPPGDDFLYDFAAPDAGTYWYHPHNRTWEQLARGLYGPLIVEEADPPEVDRDITLILDDWRLTQDAQLHDSFGAMRDWSHAGRLGNWITVNGRGESALTAQRNERLRLRLINVSNARIFSLDLKDMDGWVAALDGQPLVAPKRAGRMHLAPAQRIDLIVDVAADDGGEAFLMSHERQERFALTGISVRGKKRDVALPDPKPFPPNALPVVGDLASVRRETLVMEGGAMGGLTGATYEGSFRGMRELVGLGKAWAFNGRADMPADPWLVLSRNEPVRIAIENRTGWPHAMHLHGHHFQQVLPGGALGPHRDTILLDREEKAEIAFVADNPGDWLFHCHMVEHAAAGMMTWIRVA